MDITKLTLSPPTSLPLDDFSRPRQRIDPILRAFFDVGPDFTKNMSEKLKAAKAQVDALEKERINQRANSARDRLTQIDELLAAYMLVAQIAAAMGNETMAEQVADRITGLVSSAGTEVNALRSGIQSDDEADPQSQINAYKDLTLLVNGLTAKARGFSALVATAHRVAESKQDSDSPERIERAVNRLYEALGGPPTINIAQIETSV